MKKIKLKLERITVQQMSPAKLAEVNGGSAYITCVTYGTSCYPCPGGSLKCSPTLALCGVGTGACTNGCSGAC